MSDLVSGGSRDTEARRGEREWRLRFESIDPHEAEAWEVRNGRGVWPRLTDKRWDALPWLPPTERVSDDESDIRDQHATLCAWAETHEQPIRNVVLECRTASQWSPVS
jgi:hypothetical protein